MWHLKCIQTIYIAHTRKRLSCQREINEGAKWPAPPAERPLARPLRPALLLRWSGDGSSFAWRHEKGQRSIRSDSRRGGAAVRPALPWKWARCGFDVGLECGPDGTGWGLSHKPIRTFGASLLTSKTRPRRAGHPWTWPAPPDGRPLARPLRPTPLHLEKRKARSSDRGRRAFSGGGFARRNR